jgi:hypothetical protein
LGAAGSSDEFIKRVGAWMIVGWNAVEGGSSLRKSASYSNGLLISAMSTVAVSLLVAVICCIGWIVYKKRCNNYNQVMHGNGSEGKNFFSTPSCPIVFFWVCCPICDHGFFGFQIQKTYKCPCTLLEMLSTPEFWMMHILVAFHDHLFLVDLFMFSYCSKCRFHVSDVPW